MKITEVMRGNTWQTLGRNWSITKRVSLTEAIEEQEKLMWQSVRCYKKAHELNPENPDLFEEAEDEYNRNA